MAEEKERLFTTMYDFMRNSHELNEETYAEELSHFSKLEQKNITCVEYIEASVYPASKFNQVNMLTTMKIGKKLYYPIVGWDPNAAGPSTSETGVKIPPYRKWLNKLAKRTLHNSRENKTYVLYG